LISLVLWASQPLVAQPGGLYIGSGGGVHIAPSTALVVAGDLYSAGTLTGQPGSELAFVGTVPQGFGASGASLGTLSSSNPTQLTVADDLLVADNVHLTGGMVMVDLNKTLTLGPTAAVTGEIAGRYVRGRVSTTRTLTGSGLQSVAGLGVLIDPQGQSLTQLRVSRHAGSAALVGSKTSIFCLWEVQPSQAIGAIDGEFSWFPDNDGTVALGQAQVWGTPLGSNAWIALTDTLNAQSRTVAVALPNLSATGMMLTVADTLGVVSVDAAGGLASILAYPNPATEALHIALPAEWPLATRASLLDMQGREVRTTLLNRTSPVAALPVADLPAGLYLLRLSCGQNQHFQQISIY
jgi:hypothetical protein